jgi:hypothetical protein
VMKRNTLHTAHSDATTTAERPHNIVGQTKERGADGVPV